MKTLLLFVVAATWLAATPTRPSAQKLERKPYEDTENGYSVKYPKGWDAVPVKPSLQSAGVAAVFGGEAITINKDGFAGSWSPDFYVFVFDWEAAQPVSGAAAAEAGKREQPEDDGGDDPQGRFDIKDRLMFFSVFPEDPDVPDVDEQVKVKKLDVNHRVWKGDLHTNAGTFPAVVDTYTFRFEDRDVCLAFSMVEQRYKKWSKAFRSIAKSFKEIERVEASSLDADAGYAAFMEYHAAEAARTPGWRVLPTESRRFVIKTSSDNEKFLDEVTERLERSRDLFEQEFPPSEKIDHVSVVRVCGTEEEFHSYGGTGRGVAGWFNPRSKELVIYDAVQVDRNMSYAVMTHEAFHQYCHFMFEESEAHRWFDEGHGDYYGGIEFKGKKTRVTARMPAGLDRMSILRPMLREGSHAPIEEHVNFTHREWQSRGLKSYAQSWSIIYMLRQGALGNVPKKVWRDEYADIIPNYVSALHGGFQEAYAEALREAEAAAKEAGEDFDPETFPRVLEDDKKEAIWKGAIEASWGRIDLAEFEANWLLYGQKYLKD